MAFFVEVVPCTCFRVGDLVVVAVFVLGCPDVVVDVPAGGVRQVALGADLVAV